MPMIVAIICGGATHMAIYWGSPPSQDASHNEDCYLVSNLGIPNCTITCSLLVKSGELLLQELLKAK